MKLETQIREALVAARQEEAGGLEARLAVVEEALALLAGELDALREAAEKRPSDLTPAERADLLWRARAVLDEMGDGSE